jgi:hypothetical protein
VVCALRGWYLKKKATTPPTQTHPKRVFENAVYVFLNVLIFFYIFLYRFDVLISKIIIFLKKYFNTFLSKKHFEPPSQSQFQTF